jgi:predicted component of type VI protein secretion system
MSNEPHDHPQPEPPAAEALALLEDVRNGLADVALPLALPGAEQARLETAAWMRHSWPSSAVPPALENPPSSTLSSATR